MSRLGNSGTQRCFQSTPLSGIWRLEMVAVQKKKKKNYVVQQTCNREGPSQDAGTDDGQDEAV